MFKHTTKSKKGPWVPPPGRSRKTEKSSSKAVTFSSKVQKDYLQYVEDVEFSSEKISSLNLPVHAKTFTSKVQKDYLQCVEDAEFPSKKISSFNLPVHAKHVDENTTFLVNPSQMHQDKLNDSRISNDMLELLSLPSNSSVNENQEELKLFVCNIQQEQRVLNLYFMSMRPVSQFLNRFLANANNQDSVIKKVLVKIEEELNHLVASFEDLDYSLSMFQNTVFGDSKSEGLMKIIKIKENLLLKLLECYTDMLTVSQVALEGQCVYNVTKHEKERNSFDKQLQYWEKKSNTQASNLKDLERRLSLLQDKCSTLQSYNTTLEETNAELQRRLHYKDIEIKNLCSDKSHVFMKQNDEKLIEVIEKLKNKAQAEKTALKKALKAQKLHYEHKDQLIKKLEGDVEEKVKMLFELAAQRDRLKFQMTVANNELIQTKFQIEEIKSQKLKSENELCEKEVDLRNKFQEATDTLKQQLTETVENKLQMKKTISRLEDELSTAKKELEELKSSQNNVKAVVAQNQNDCSSENASDQVRNLISLLEDTNEYLKNIRSPDIAYKGEGAQTDMTPNTENILTIVQDIKKQIVELKRPNLNTDQGDSSKTDLQTHLKELEQQHKALSKENASLKSQINDLKNAEQMPQLENFSAANMGSDFSAKNLQMELMLKTEEIWRIKQREKKLEYQLEEVKDKLQKKEMENCRIFTLEESLKRNEEELKSKKMEFSVLEKKKLEESERLLHRNKELQDALDEMTSNCESLQRYTDKLKSSLYNVFGNS